VVASEKGAMKVLITGAAGFIASHLTEACLERGWVVTAVDSLTTYYSPRTKVCNAAAFERHKRCTYLERDLVELDLPRLLADTDIVFHLAAQAGVRASWGQSFDVYTQLNVTVLQRLLEAARLAESLQRFVFVSSSSVYGDAARLPTSEEQILRPISPYGATKALGEHLCYLYFRNYGLPAVMLRYFSVYGPRQRPDMAFHRAIEAGLCGHDFVVFGDGHQTRDFTFVADIVAGTIALALGGTDGRAYNLGGGHRVSLMQAIDLIQQEVPSLRVTTRTSEFGDARDTAADISRAMADVGYRPRWSLEDGIRAQVAWQRSVPMTRGKVRAPLGPFSEAAVLT
jgi:nucleoside-diphosphate-sugar epimerase